MQARRDGPHGGEEALELWYAIGRAFSEAGEAKGRAVVTGFTAALVSGALVLLSAPVFGTAWAGPFAALIPVAVGLLLGLGHLALSYAGAARRFRAISGELGRLGLDGRRPTLSGLGAYHDVQLILLRSEYEFLLLRGAGRSARLLADSFGFTPEDPFECGPLDVAPETPRMAGLRRRWERRLKMRRRHGMIPPALGLREDLAYGVFPRKMTPAAEAATRRAYLTISRELAGRRYGRKELSKGGAASVPEEIRERLAREAEEYEILNPRPGAPRRGRATSWPR